ncbi:transmembrane protease serine 9 [Scaptodrosophila lebanonensis]|uniref:Phenoloxidase-activating factor 2 n=1 Tax=Drosophila lebanonensis TaxID=7225 RepID=A0A6J2TMB6_DROLE|nr:transmembrane protease serine 9 [Scaptodrosophila lebanonensis]
MFAFLQVLLLSVHLLHAVAAPEAFIAANVTAEDATIAEAAAATAHTRNNRQLFFDPSLFLLQGGLGGGAWEGSKCLTPRGQSGVCVRIDSCRQYYRVARQLTFIALRQWPPQAALSLGADLCNFYDQLGRVNNGICCTTMDAPAFGAFPIPAPTETTTTTPTTTTTTTTTERPAASADELDKVEEEDEPAFVEAELPVDSGSSVEDTPDFQDINTIEAHAPAQPDTTVYPYQWPFGSFAGGVAQWPPPIPTHPPTLGGWPPPIPTHPPNHHYPTHPSTVGAQRPTTPSTVLTTRRTTPRPTTRPTTTRRPSYPSYPGYPSPTAPATTTPTTTRRPATGGGVSAEGLPLQCGIRNPVSPDQERIVGGINASPHEFPWMAVLFKSGKQFCGGSLITNNHILTAAHCVARMTSWDVAALTAHLGDYNIRTDFEVQHVSRRIKRLVRHKGFEFSTLHNDIAILTLSEPVPFTQEIQPVCLPTSAAQQTRSYSGQVATVAGWGSLRENGPQPSILQKVDIPIWPNLECARKYGRAAPGGIIESMICAGQASKDSCSGDSGGPMIVSDGGRYTQVGIVSWGIGCGKGQYPGVYTRVTSLLPWIYKNIK